MNLRKHYLMTGLALFFLGIIVSRPGEYFQPKEKRICSLARTKIDCVTKNSEINLDENAIYYQSE